MTKHTLGVILFILAIIIGSVIMGNKFYIAVKNGYIESSSVRKKEITGVYYYFLLSLYLLVVLIGISIIGIIIYFNWD